jgi:hypothetical protein
MRIAGWEGKGTRSQVSEERKGGWTSRGGRSRGWRVNVGWDGRPI